MTVNSSETAAFEPARRIRAILPDDGTDRRLLEGLWRDKGVTRADTVPVRAVAALLEAHTQRGRLPEPVLARLVTVIVTLAEATECSTTSTRPRGWDAPAVARCSWTGCPARPFTNCRRNSPYSEPVGRSTLPLQRKQDPWRASR